jgi:hypothetical protein
MSRGQEFLPDQSSQNALHFLHAHIDMLDHRSVDHPCGNIPPTAFLLEVMETREDDAFLVGETVSNIRKIFPRVRDRHVKCSPWIDAEEMETMLF